jgi:methylenetetrahydrofolate--tRNA-(uracil-5-)-methyltransferase
MSPPPPTTAIGALLAHITGGHLSADGEGAGRSFQPMNVNFGLFPPIAAATQGKRGLKGLDRKRALAARALADLDLWLSRPTSVAAE